MLYILVKNGKEQVAKDFLRKVMNDNVSYFNFAALSYPNNLFLFYLYYGRSFIPEKGKKLTYVSPIDILIPVIKEKKG